MDWEPSAYTGGSFKIQYLIPQGGTLCHFRFFMFCHVWSNTPIFMIWIDLVRACLTLMHKHAGLHVCFAFMKCPLRTSRHSDLGGAFQRLSLTGDEILQSTIHLHPNYDAQMIREANVLRQRGLCVMEHLLSRRPLASTAFMRCLHRSQPFAIIANAYSMVDTCWQRGKDIAIACSLHIVETC